MRRDNIWGNRRTKSKACSDRYLEDIGCTARVTMGDDMSVTREPTGTKTCREYSDGDTGVNGC